MWGKTSIFQLGSRTNCEIFKLPDLGKRFTLKQVVFFAKMEGHVPLRSLSKSATKCNDLLRALKLERMNKEEFYVKNE